MLLITTDNPAIFAQDNEKIVGALTNVILKVYVDGLNPVPSSSDISWSFNGNPLPVTSYYTLQNGNKDLVISNASSNVTTGIYESTVTTAQGTRSVYINVSYYGQ